MRDPATGHFWINERCQYCGIPNDSVHAQTHCPGTKHESVEDDWSPSVFTLPVFESTVPIMDTVAETAVLSEIANDTPAVVDTPATDFAGGDSGGGGGGGAF